MNSSGHRPNPIVRNDSEAPLDDDPNSAHVAPTRTPPQGSRRTLRTSLALGALALGLLALGLARRPSVSAEVPGVVTIERDGYRYAYQVITGEECLFDLSADPAELRNLAASRPELTSALRRELAAELRVDRLEALRERAEHADAIRRLRALGYL